MFSNAAEEIQEVVLFCICSGKAQHGYCDATYVNLYLDAENQFLNEKHNFRIRMSTENLGEACGL